MSTGKKFKKPKGKTLPLNEFLQDNTGMPIRKASTLNWADEVESMFQSYEVNTNTQLLLPTAPKAAREEEDFASKVPDNPPYIAYVSNLPYDASEDEVLKHFGDLKIINVRIPKDDRFANGKKIKGFGYLEFENRQNLLSALSLNDRVLKNRFIKVEVATNIDTNKSREKISKVYSKQSKQDWRYELKSKNRNKDFNHAPRSQSITWRNNTYKNNREKNFNNYGARSGSIDRFALATQKIEGNRNRPKLNLAPRTKPFIDKDKNFSDQGSDSIFGNAKPVDTSVKERQIEERLAQERNYKMKSDNYERIYTSKKYSRQNANNGGKIKSNGLNLKYEENRKKKECGNTLMGENI